MFKKLLLGLLLLSIVVSTTIIFADWGAVCIPLGPCNYYVRGDSEWLPGGQPNLPSYAGESFATTKPNPTGIDFTAAYLKGWRMGCTLSKQVTKCPTVGTCGNSYVDLTYADFDLTGVVYHAAKHKAYEGTVSEGWFTSPDASHSNKDAYQGYYGGVCPNRQPDDD